MRHFPDPLTISHYLFTLGTIVLITLLLFSEQGLSKNDRQETSIITLKGKNNQLMAEIKQLNQRIKLVQENEFYQQSVIRRETGYINQNELLFIFEK